MGDCPMLEMVGSGNDSLMSLDPLVETCVFVGISLGALVP